MHYEDDYDVSHLLLMNESSRPHVILATRERQASQLEPEDDYLQEVFMNQRDTGLFELEQWIKQKLSRGGCAPVHYRNMTPLQKQQSKGI